MVERMRGLTSTQGSHAGFRSEDVASAIPVGGPRKLSQTSRKRDSSASLHLGKIIYQRMHIRQRMFISKNSVLKIKKHISSHKHQT